MELEQNFVKASEIVVFWHIAAFCRYRLISIVAMYFSSCNQAKIYIQWITGLMWELGVQEASVGSAVLSPPNPPFCVYRQGLFMAKNEFKLLKKCIR